MKYIAYYRVSTQQQGHSGLGLEAQRNTVLMYIKHNGNELIAEFTEVESGRNNNRPILQQAINQAKYEQAVLVIAKLDRLSRNVTFISTLMESKVRFLCCDMPDATELTIHLFAAIAQWEHTRISTRIREAMAAKRRKEPTWRPGTDNFTDESRRRGAETNIRHARDNQQNRHAFHFILPLRERGLSYRAIADMLNTEGYKTRNGAKFQPTQVHTIYKRFTDNN